MTIANNTSGSEELFGTDVPENAATFSGNASGYRLDVNNGQIHVVDIDAADGVDETAVISGVELLRFADREFAISSMGPYGETLVNSTTADYQGQASLISLEDGGYVAAWAAYGQDGSEYGVYLQRYDANGAKVGNEVQVNSTTANSQSAPAIAALNDGGYIVTWQGYGQDTSSQEDIYSQRYDASGLKVGNETRVNETIANEQAAPSITGLADGGYVITWQSSGQDGSGSGIYAQRYNAEGEKISTEVRVNTTSENDQNSSVVTALKDGGYVVTWESSAQDGNGKEIYLQRFDVNGVPDGAEVLVNTTTAHNQSAPFVSGLNDGGYIVTWASQMQDGSSHGIYLQRFDVTGAKIGIETLVNSTTLNSQNTPAATSLADGGFVIAWESYGQDGSQFGIYIQRFNATGDKVGNETLVNLTSENWQVSPALASLTDGGFIVTWQSDGQDGSGYGIYAQRFDANGEPIRYLEITGTDIGDEIHGGHGAQRIVGGAGDDILDGGTGADLLIGGDGADTYYVDHAGDVVVENPSMDFSADTVSTTVTYALNNNVENLTLAGTGAIDGTGNALDNIIYGNDADNVLDGRAGIDNLFGGLGNDTYVISDDDIIVEYFNEGNDQVISSISWTLAEHLEHLLLSGSDHTSGAGNSLDNTIVGNTGANALYGDAGDDTLAGGAGDDRLNGGLGSDTLIGGIGDDTYIADEEDTLIEMADQGYDIVESDYSFVLGDNLEALRLTGLMNTNGTGNAQANIIIGNSFNNVLDGGAGIDVLRGDLGNDVYIVDAAEEMVFVQENINEGTDTVKSTVSWTLGDNFENLELLGIENLNATGNELANTIVGNSGDNTLNGKEGADVLIGGDGNDIYFMGTGDTIVETNSDKQIGGIDHVFSAINTSLSNNLENLTLTGTSAIYGYGNALDNILIGNQANNSLSGDSGNDVLEGRQGDDTLLGDAGNDILDGGEGNDAMRGGAGNDTYFIDSLSDVVNENDTFGRSGRHNGIDTVVSTITYSLGDWVENLRLYSSNPINGTGNELDNVIYAGNGDNVISGGRGNDTVSYLYASSAISISLSSTQLQNTGGSGLDTLQSIENVTGSDYNDTIIGNSSFNHIDGGKGADTMNGGGGTDTYYVDDAGDTVIESAHQSGGYDDLIIASVSYTLSDNVEHLRLNTTENINGTGNALNNTIYAGAGVNEIDGGTGIDTLSYRDSTSATNLGITLNLSALNQSGQATASGISGADLVKNIENITGSRYDDVLTGDAGTNVLNGGYGNDVLNGGAGVDYFLFNSFDGVSTNIDTIIGFNPIDDVIQISGNVFMSLAPTNEAYYNWLSASSFRANSTGTAVDANDYILYQTGTGKLFYDEDGSGSIAKVHFATLSGNPTITANDFFIVTGSY